MAAFKAELQISNWDDVTGHSDPNSAYETILNKYSASYIRCFPLNKVKARNGCLNKPWLSKRLLKSINRKIFYISAISVIPLPTAKINTKNIEINQLVLYVPLNVYIMRRN